MHKLSILVLLVAAAAYVIADECENCACGQACDGSSCADGCMIYDKFVPAGESQAVYGRDCKCSTEVDEKGRIVQCEEGVEFVDAPAGSAWTLNPQC